MITLLVGDVLLGYCGGEFGRDSHSLAKRVEAVGSDWIVVREDSHAGRVLIATGPDVHRVLGRFCVRLGAHFDESDETFTMVVEAKL